MGCAASQFNSTFTPIPLMPQERYLLGLLLTGKCDEVSKRSPSDFVQMVVHQEEVKFLVNSSLFFTSRASGFFYFNPFRFLIYDGS